MNYVIDTCSIREFAHYYPSNFANFWEKLDTLVFLQRIISVREVFNELQLQGCPDFLKQWANDNSHIFLEPSYDEIEFVKGIFLIPHFKQIISTRNMLEGRPVADPFIISLAAVNDYTVITEEKCIENAAKIPNICDYFKIPCINLQKMMNDEEWNF